MSLRTSEQRYINSLPEEERPAAIDAAYARRELKRKATLEKNLERDKWQVVWKKGKYVWRS